MDKHRREQHKKVIEHFGELAQTEKLVEEVQELLIESKKILELVKVGKKIPEQLIYNFMAEAGDVMNCVEQRIIMENVKPEYVENSQDFKMQRTVMKIQMN